MEQAEIEDTAGLRKVDGAAALLVALPSGSWAVVTSGTRLSATSRLRHTGLPIPQVLVGAEDIEKGKPDPECYLKGAQLLGAPAEQCVVVEDTLAGIRASCSAGMATVALTTTHRSSELSDADALVRTLGDIRLDVRRRVRTTRRYALERAIAAPDLVMRNFTPEGPDRLWVADITYARSWEGWLYIAFVLDAFSRKVVGWSMANHLRTELVLDALNMAIHNRRPLQVSSFTPIAALSTPR